MPLSSSSGLQWLAGAGLSTVALGSLAGLAAGPASYSSEAVIEAALHPQQLWCARQSKVRAAVPLQASGWARRGVGGLA